MKCPALYWRINNVEEFVRTSSKNEWTMNKCLVVFAPRITEVWVQKLEHAADRLQICAEIGQVFFLVHHAVPVISLNRSSQKDI